MKCNVCGKIIEDGSDFCYFCGTVFNENAIEHDSKEINQINEKLGISDAKVIAKPSQNKRDNEKEVPKQTAKRGKSFTGIVIEILSIIILIVGFVGACILMDKVGAGIGLAIMVGVLLFGLMCFGFGKVICLLTEINSKIK